MEIFCQHGLLGYVFQMFMIYPTQNSKLVYTFELFLLKPMHGDGIVYLTVLAPSSLFPIGTSSEYYLLSHEGSHAPPR